SLTCIMKDHVLIRGGLSGMRSNSRWKAPCMATCLVPGQESAEVIVVRRQRTKDRTQRREKARHARPV
ncbi:hypothetical protein, partial [Desulfogranum japonicum]|uniref:hypothetical protein n=1 Tax=Desulfogranum japonicum TaxID=231447 RepID=UPI001E4E977E